MLPGAFDLRTVVARRMLLRFKMELFTLHAVLRASLSALRLYQHYWQTYDGVFQQHGER